jgi:hypothetical protein
MSRQSETFFDPNAWMSQPGAQPSKKWAQNSLARSSQQQTGGPTGFEEPWKDRLTTAGHRFLSPVKHAENVADAVRNPGDRLKDPGEVFFGPLSDLFGGYF